MLIKSILDQMTLEEKAALCSGETFWTTKAIERLDVPSLFVCDGPHGLRKQDNEGDNLGVKKSLPATCFPTASAIGSSWDVNLLSEVGSAIAQEALSMNVDIVLGPGINIKRSPLCGRNFEYYSEDPYLSGKLGAAAVGGIQSKGVGTSLKHFALNNQEEERMTISSNADMRTMRELYLSAFETVIKESKPTTVMCSYNRINGEYASDSQLLLKDILREEWGFEGFVVTDWGALNNKLASLEAGCDLEMPTSNRINDLKIVDAVKNGQLDIVYLDKAVERILSIVDQCVQGRNENATYNIEEHNDLARKAASESAVLLKNDDGLLPLKVEDQIAVIGEFAKVTRFQGGGSSHVNAHRVLNAYEELCKISGHEMPYSIGYDINSNEIDEEKIAGAVKLAKEVDKVIVFIGLPDSYESEGYDRETINMPVNQLRLLEAVAEVNENIVVTLYNGSVVEMASWRDQVKSILDCWLGGQAVGGAVADILYGIVNPSGRLAESFPMKLEDNPSYLSYQPFNDEVNYSEGIYVGYRYYETVGREVAYSFGHGLSYTTFAYNNLRVNKEAMSDTDDVAVTVEVTNTGSLPGKEVVQLYVGKDKGLVQVPKLQLRGFEKVSLSPGETKVVNFSLSKRDFAYYDVLRNDFMVESNKYYIKVGSSSQKVLLEATIEVTSADQLYVREADPNSKLGDLVKDPKTNELLTPVIGMLTTFFQSGADAEVLSEKMIEKTMNALTLRALVNFTGGQFSEENMYQIIHFYNTTR